MTSRKTILALASAAVGLGACAYDPYYNGYDDGYRGPRYGSAYAPQDPYYAPGYYYGPNVGFGLAYSDRRDGHEHHWRDDDEHRWHHDHD